MNKKLIFILGIITILMISSVAAINLTSVAFTNRRNRNNIDYFAQGDSPTVSAVWASSGDANLFCDDDGNFADCGLNISDPTVIWVTDCIAYSYLNDSSTPVPAIWSTPVTSQGDFNYYCHVCNSTGTCDNTTFSGSSSGSFRVAGATQTNLVLFGLIIILVAFALLVGINRGVISHKEAVMVIVSGVFGWIIVQAIIF